MSKIVKGVVNVVRNVVGGIFGGGDQQPAPVVQQAPAPTPMPTPDDKAIQEAKKKSIASVLNRTGRASTILTANNQKDTLGV